MNIIKRIRKVIEDSELSSAGFADKIGVQRSSISHILSGRNKPSLDFILKVLNAFPTVQSDWLLLGAVPKTTTTASMPNLFAADETPEIPTHNKETELPPTQTPIQENTIESIANEAQEVERVVIFYTDGLCSTYTNKK